jgi:type III secretory pathway lipoprotein EscJ
LSWQKIYDSQAAHQAEIVRALLESKEIPANILQKQDSTYQLWGSYEVFVPSEYVLKAIKLIQENDQTESIL